MMIGSAVALALIAASLGMAVQAQRAPLPGDIALKEDSAAQRSLKWTMPDGPGTGPFPAIKAVDPAFPDHVIYRPRDIASVARPLPVLLWGNGGCRADGAGARLLLEEIASHGYFVIAPGAILTGPEIPMPATDPDTGKSSVADVLAGLDLATKSNTSASPYRGKLDLKHVAVAGTSCGGLQALQAAADPRIKAVIGFHTGFFNDDRAPNTGAATSKDQLRAIHLPILYILGGPRDIAYVNGMDDFDKIDHVPVFVADHAVGHLGTFNQANGGSEAVVALGWLQWQLYGDAKGKAMFTGEDCTLCKDGSWTLKRKNIGKL
jgi:dienelactone hydrolase